MDVQMQVKLVREEQESPLGLYQKGQNLYIYRQQCLHCYLCYLQLRVVQ
jgi:hypothetical protein